MLRTSVRLRALPAARLSALAGGVLLAVASLGLAAPASAEAQVTVTTTDGATDAVVAPGSVVTVDGAGFQSIQGGAGGIYVMFGWVDDAEGGSWRPSNGGVTGHSYLYAPDEEGLDNAGLQRFVSFPGSGTAAAANGGVVAEDGSWSVQLTIPAAQFEALDREGNPAPVDCAEVQCGIITFGAHGVKNANNESFTPVTFGSAEGATPAEESPEPTAEEPETTEAAEPSSEVTTQASDATSATADSATTTPPADEDGSSSALVLWASIAGGLALIAVIVVTGVRRARARAEAETSAAAGPDAGTGTSSGASGADAPQA